MIIAPANPTVTTTELGSVSLATTITYINKPDETDTVLVIEPVNPTVTTTEFGSVSEATTITYTNPAGETDTVLVIQPFSSVVPVLPSSSGPHYYNTTVVSSSSVYSSADVEYSAQNIPVPSLTSMDSPVMDILSSSALVSTLDTSSIVEESKVDQYVSSYVSSEVSEQNVASNAKTSSDIQASSQSLVSIETESSIASLSINSVYYSSVSKESTVTFISETTESTIVPSLSSQVNKFSIESQGSPEEQSSSSGYDTTSHTEGVTITVTSNPLELLLFQFR